MENKRSFRYMTIEEFNNGLQISLNEEGIELVKELKEDGKSEFDIWYELFEDVRGNSEYIFHDDMGESGFGLTNAEGITDGYYNSDEGDGYKTDYPESAKVYWFPNYMITSSLDKMFEEGKVFFTKADENVVEPIYKNGGSIYDVKKVKSHSDFLNLIKELESKIRLVGNEGYGDSDSPYSKEYVSDGDIINVKIEKYIEKGKPTYYTWKWSKAYANGGGVGKRFIFGIEYKEKPSSRVFKKSSLTMVGNDNKEMNDAINENAELLKEQEGWHEVKITKKPIMDNGGSINDDTIVRNKNKNDWKSKFDFYLKFNESNIGKGTLMDMAYDNTKGIDSAIPQSLVGDVDNSAFYVFDYKDNFDGKLVDLREKLKFSNTKVNVTIVVNGNVLYKDKLPDELLNPTFHQALDYVFNHDEVEAFDIRPRKDKYAKGGGVNRPFSFTNDKIFTKDNISVQRVGGSDMWEVSINGEPKGRVLGAQTSDYAIKKAEIEFKNKYANGGKVQGIKMNFKVYADDDYAREEEESKILLLRKYFDFDEVDGKIDYESSLYNTNLKFYNKGKEVMTLKGDYNNDKEELDAIIRIGDSESKLNYHPYDGMGGFSSFLLEEQIKNSAKELKTYTAVVSVEGYEKYSEEFDNIDSAKRSIKDIKSNTKFQVVKGEVGEGKLVKDDKVIDTFSNGGGIEKWKSVQSIKFKTKKEANKRLKLHKSDNDIRNSRIEEVSKGDDLNHGYVIKYEIIDKENKYENGGGVEKELNGYRVNIYKSKNYNSPQNVVSNEFDEIILVTDGIKGDSSSVMSNEPYIKLVRRNLFGKEILSAEPVNFGVDKNHKMFGGTFVWSSDSRFRNDISERPIALHDRVEVYENGGVFVSPHVNDLHNYIIKSYGFLLPNEDESGYNKFTYSDFAEELKSNYDIKNPRNKQVYDYLIHLGNVPMFSGNVADMKKIEERMSTADVKFENGGDIINENALMVMNDNKQIKHHSEELNKVVGKNTQVPAWVLSKVHRSASDLSDATHYLDGVNSEFEEGGKISYGSIKKEKERMTSELFEKCGVFFAFSNEQFTKNKTPLKEGEKYVSIGAGCYMPKGNVDAFRKGMKEISQFGKNKVKENKLAETEILYELNNHECFYTGDYSDVVDMFKGTYTEEQIRDVYNKNIDKYSNGGTVESLEKELRKLQRDLNSRRLSTYMEGDESEEQKARNKEREVKLARFNEVLGLLREKDSKFSKGGGINSGRDLLFKSNEPHEKNYNRKREFKKYGSNENWFNDFFEEGGKTEHSFSGYLGEIISIDLAELALGRKINSWKDGIITIDGIQYEKVFMKPEYKQIK